MIILYVCKSTRFIVHKLLSFSTLEVVSGIKFDLIGTYKGKKIENYNKIGIFTQNLRLFLRFT